MFPRSVALLGALAMMACFATAIDTYCGVPPFPAPISPLPPAPENSKLALGMIFFRHGDRTPTTSRTCWKTIPAEKWDTCDTYQADTPGILPHPFYLPTANTPSIRVNPLAGETAYGGNCHVGQLTVKGTILLEPLSHIHTPC